MQPANTNKCQVASLTYGLLLGLSQRPPRMSEIMIKAIATQVNIVLSVERPMAKNAIPRMRNALDAFRLFCFIQKFLSR